MAWVFLVNLGVLFVYTCTHVQLRVWGYLFFFSKMLEFQSFLMSAKHDKQISDRPKYVSMLAKKYKS